MPITHGPDGVQVVQWLPKRLPLEDGMLVDALLGGLPEVRREYKFHPTRGWRMDYAWPEWRVGVEVNGGNWTQGRHTRGRGYEADLSKVNHAQIRGWILLQFTLNQLRVELAKCRRQVEAALVARGVVLP